MKLGSVKLFLITTLLLMMAPAIFAQDFSKLIDTLYEKGILDAVESESLLQEIQKPEGPAPLIFKGDFRLRFQSEKRGTTAENRNRLRIRLRLGTDIALNDTLKLKFGVASGAADPKSTNQTLQDSFQHPDLRLDYAYLDYQASDQLRLVGGRFHNPLWTTDLLWDTDIMPDGFGFNYKSRLFGLDAFVNGGFFLIDEISGSALDPNMIVIQPGVKFAIDKGASARVAVTYTGTQYVTGKILDNNAASNTGATTGLANQYNNIGFTTELVLTNTKIVPQMSVIFDWTKNMEVTTEGVGYMLGVEFGDKKIADLGNWQFKTSYRELSRNAWLDILPDADYYGGATFVKGMRYGLTYGLSSNTSAGASYFVMANKDGSAEENLLQLDLNTKF